jgi:ABC-2 type transport system permease protein
MNSVFYQMFYAVKRMIMNFKPILINMLAYAVIILILGSVFGSSYNVSQSLEPVTLAYANLDSGGNGALVDEVLQADEVTEFAILQPVSSLEEGLERVRQGEVDAMLYLPPDFSADPALTRDIKVYLSEDYGLATLVVQNIMRSLTQQMNTSHVVYNMTSGSGIVSQTAYEPDGASEADEADEAVVEAPVVAPSALPQSNPNEAYITAQPLTDTEAKATTAMGYYSIAMILMLLLYGQEYGIFIASEDYLGTLGQRLRLAPTRLSAQYIGKVIGLSLVTFGQAVVLLLLTRYVYGVDWGGHLFIVLLTLFVLSLLATLLGLWLVIITRSAEKSHAISHMITIGGTFLIGGFVIVDFGAAAYLSPSYYAKAALTSVIYGGQVDQALLYIGAMIGICAVLVLGCLVLEPERRNGSHQIYKGT